MSQPLTPIITAVGITKSFGSGDLFTTILKGQRFFTVAEIWLVDSVCWSNMGTIRFWNGSPMTPSVLMRK